MLLDEGDDEGEEDDEEVEDDDVEVDEDELEDESSAFLGVEDSEVDPLDGFSALTLPARESLR
ncbi:hypothetical protein [Actinoplanes rectilineatus]|uniref:hypothetical protein n=1 Tax=Actinoplanes rectilineatus TaxID=113571 RepID=UPI0005F28076|nr:hypothetical protein [Actinoplanes rectilineatus]